MCDIMLQPHLHVGLVPEQLVQRLAAKKVDCNFGEILPQTRKMVAIFAEAYSGCQVISAQRHTAADQPMVACCVVAHQV